VAADARKTKVVLSIGSSFKAYRSGETARGYGFLAIRYLDASVLVRSDPPVLG
jgi:hypothetical protein